MRQSYDGEGDWEGDTDALEDSDGFSWVRTVIEGDSDGFSWVRTVIEGESDTDTDTDADAEGIVLLEQ